MASCACSVLALLLSGASAAQPGVGPQLPPAATAAPLAPAVPSAQALVPASVKEQQHQHSPAWISSNGSEAELQESCAAQGYERACTYHAQWPQEWHGRRLCCNGGTPSGPTFRLLQGQDAAELSWGSASVLCGLSGMALCSRDTLCWSRASGGAPQQAWLPAANAQDMWVLPVNVRTGDSCGIRFARKVEHTPGAGAGFWCCPEVLELDMRLAQAGTTFTPKVCSGASASSMCPAVMAHGDVCQPTCSGSDQQLVGHYTCLAGSLQGEPRCVLPSSGVKVVRREGVMGQASVFLDLGGTRTGGIAKFDSGLMKQVLAFAFGVKQGDLSVQVQFLPNARFWEQALGSQFAPSAAEHLALQFQALVAPGEGARVQLAAQELGVPGTLAYARCNQFLEAMIKTPELDLGASSSASWTWVQTSEPVYFLEEQAHPLKGHGVLEPLGYLAHSATTAPPPPPPVPAPTAPPTPAPEASSTGSAIPERLAFVVLGASLVAALGALYLLWRLRNKAIGETRAYAIVDFGEVQQREQGGEPGSCLVYNQILDSIQDCFILPPSSTWSAIAYVLIKDADAGPGRKGRRLRRAFVCFCGCLSFTLQSAMLFWITVHVVLPAARSVQDAYSSMHELAYDSDGQSRERDDLDQLLSFTCGFPSVDVCCMSAVFIAWVMQCFVAFQANVALIRAIQKLPQLPPGLPASDQIHEDDEGAIGELCGISQIVCLAPLTRWRIMWVAMAPKLALLSLRSVAGAFWLLTAQGFFPLLMTFLVLGFVSEIDALIYASCLPTKMIGTLAKVRLALPQSGLATRVSDAKTGASELGWDYIWAPSLQAICCALLALLALRLQQVLPGYAWDFHEYCQEHPGYATLTCNPFDLHCFPFGDAKEGQA